MLENLKNILNKPGNKSTEPVQQPIVGVDISHSYVRLVQLEKKKKVWSLVKLSAKVLEDSYENEDKRNEAIVTQLKNLKLEQKLQFDQAAISLPVNSAIVQVVQIPYLEEEELKEAADNGSLWDTAINVPGEISEYSIFWQTIKKDREKNTLSLLFVASRVDEIEKNCDLVRKAGFDPLVVDVRCFALRNILKTHPDGGAKGTQVFVEISGQENYAVCMHDDLPFIYDIYVSDDDADALVKGGEGLTDELFTRVASQVRTATTSFMKQSGVPGIEEIQFSSSLPFAKKIYERFKSEIVEYKINLMDPFNNLQIPSALKSRLQSEKNGSSFGIALGLATRQLDVFGYFKFVTAVSNINLLPDRADRATKEKKKSVTTGLMQKLSILSTLFFGSTLAIYFYMVTTMYSVSDTESMKINAMNEETKLAEKTEELGKLKAWTQTSGAINSKLLDISFSANLPNGTYVSEIQHYRSKPSLFVFKARDPAISGKIINILSKDFKNVTLKDIQSPNKKGGLNTININYLIK